MGWMLFKKLSGLFLYFRNKTQTKDKQKKVESSQKIEKEEKT